MSRKRTIVKQVTDAVLQYSGPVTVKEIARVTGFTHKQVPTTLSHCLGSKNCPVTHVCYATWQRKAATPHRSVPLPFEGSITKKVIDELKKSGRPMTDKELSVIIGHPAVNLMKLFLTGLHQRPEYGVVRLDPHTVQYVGAPAPAPFCFEEEADKLSALADEIVSEIGVEQVEEELVVAEKTALVPADGYLLFEKVGELKKCLVIRDENGVYYTAFPAKEVEERVVTTVTGYDGETYEV